MKIIKLLCIGLTLAGQVTKKWNTSMLCSGIKEFWYENSNSSIKFLTDSKHYKSDSARLAIGEQEIKNKFHDYDLYAIINQKNKVSHAGNRVAHLGSDLIRTGNHEVGHLLGLGHSGVTGNMYGDRFSVMGKFPSEYIAGPQYLHLGIIEVNNQKVDLCLLKDWDCKGFFLYKEGDLYYSTVRKNGKKWLLAHKCRNGCKGTTLISKNIVKS